MREYDEQLEKIEKYLHEVILVVSRGVFPDKQLPLPELGSEMIDSAQPDYYPIFGMMGGVTFRILSKDGKLKLVANAASRMNPNYEQKFEITGDGWTEVASETATGS